VHQRARRPCDDGQASMSQGHDHHAYLISTQTQRGHNVDTCMTVL
jgi:hypothetical protein